MSHLRVLTVNAGSSSLKLSLLDGDRVITSRHVETPDGLDGGPAEGALAELLGGTDPPDAVGHRVVHGGGVYTRAVRIDTQVRAHLEEFVQLAPLHQPAALAGIDLVSRALPDVPAVACFDTAFHATMPEAATTYAVPASWRDDLGLRKHGFHGLSHAYASRRSAALVDRPAADLRIVVCHLGAGASLCAVRGGESVDTTMGFTPLAGLVMATRPGDVDPGILIWLLRHTSLDVDAIENALEHGSGLAGLAGTADMQKVLARAEKGDPDAAAALAVYVHRLRSGVGGMVASLGGLDVLTFTGGVGEQAPAVRALATAGLGYLGVGIDIGRNSRARSDADISAAGMPVRCLVVHAREDLQIAAEVQTALTQP